MLRWFCLALVATGCVVMTVATVRYHRFWRASRQESYTRGGSKVAGILTYLVMLFCIFGYLVGMTDIIRRDVEPIYLFVSVVFFVGGVFIAALVHNQISTAADLRGKATEVMRTFVNAIEMKDAYTRGHSYHVYRIVELFYKNLPERLRQQVNGPKLLDAAMLHDIGKMGIPDNVLNKAGPLSDTEWEAVRAHPENGRKMLAGTCFEEIGPWVLYHHERMDGQGYHGLAGEAIPLEARIIAVADTYSVITTDREYRAHRSHAEALRELCRVAGTQLDADLVACFCTLDAAQLQVLAPRPGGDAQPIQPGESA